MQSKLKWQIHHEIHVMQGEKEEQKYYEGKPVSGKSLKNLHKNLSRMSQIQ